jgi:hypothetical protein
MFSVVGQAFSQASPPGTKHIKRIDAKVFRKGEIVDSKLSFTYYDSLWKELKDENTLNGALRKKTFDLTILDTPLKKIYGEVDETGDTLGQTVYVYNDLGQRVYNFQLKGKDTLVNQMRKYDARGNNTEMYTKTNGKYILWMRWEYNDKNEQILRESFSKNGDLLKSTMREWSEDGKVVKTYDWSKNQYLLSTMTTKIDELHTRTDHYISSVGINYGINLFEEKGGYSEVEKDKSDNLKRLEIYNAKGELTTLVVFTFEDVD